MHSHKGQEVISIVLTNTCKTFCGVILTCCWVFFIYHILNRAVQIMDILAQMMKNWKNKIILAWPKYKYFSSSSDSITKRKKKAKQCFSSTKNMSFDAKQIVVFVFRSFNHVKNINLETKLDIMATLSFGKCYNGMFWLFQNMFPFCVNLAEIIYSIWLPFKKSFRGRLHLRMT